MKKSFAENCIRYISTATALILALAMLCCANFSAGAKTLGSNLTITDTTSLLEDINTTTNTTPTKTKDIIASGAGVEILSTGAYTGIIYVDTKNLSSSWSSVYLHYWGGDSSKWPGETMTSVGDGIYSYDLSTKSGVTGCIFHNGSGTQTGDLTIPSTDNSMFVLNSEGKNGEWSTYSGGSDTPTGDLTIYYKNTNNWSTVNIYCWQNSDANNNNHAWPGESMTKVEGTDNIYSYKISASSKWDKCIFSSNGSNQTSNQTIPTGGKNYYNGSSWTTLYTVTFNNNGYGTAPATQYVVSGGTATDPGTLTAEGQTFGGWYTDEDFTTKANFPYTVTSNVTFYAKWTQNASSSTWRLSGDFNSWNQSDDSAKFTGNGNILTLSYYLGVANNNYGFKLYNGKNWYGANSTITSDKFENVTFEIKDGLGGEAYIKTTVAGTYTFTLDVSNTNSPKLSVTYPTLTKHTITIDYKGQGGTNDTAEVDDGGTYTLPVPNVVTGYEFKGWFTSDNFDELNKINGNSIENVTQDITIYAKWENAVYHVTLDRNGGSVDENNDITSYTYGTEVILPDGNDVTREGYTFIGWTDSNDNPVRKIEATDTGDKTFTAQWQANTYTVTLKMNDSTEVTYSTIDVTYDGKYTLPVANPTRTNYTFDGWYTEKTGGTKVTNETTVVIARNHNLYAHWIKNPTVTVECYDDKGNKIKSGAGLTLGDGENSSTTQIATVEYNSSTSVKFTASAGTNQYHFLGFYTEKSVSESNKISTEYDFTNYTASATENTLSIMNVKADVTLYAIFSQLYAINFDVKNLTSLEVTDNDSNLLLSDANGGTVYVRADMQLNIQATVSEDYKLTNQSWKKTGAGSLTTPSSGSATFTAGQGSSTIKIEPQVATYTGKGSWGSKVLRINGHGVNGYSPWYAAKFAVDNNDSSKSTWVRFTLVNDTPEFECVVPDGYNYVKICRMPNGNLSFDATPWNTTVYIPLENSDAKYRLDLNNSIFTATLLRD